MSTGDSEYTTTTLSGGGATIGKADQGASGVNTDPWFVRLANALGAIDFTPGDTDAQASLPGVVGRLQGWTGSAWERLKSSSSVLWVQLRDASGAAVVPALDTTLTGGNQKAIPRGGAKGSTTAADVTSTAQGADHQGLDVQLRDSSGNSLPLPTALGGSGGLKTEGVGTAGSSAGGVVSVQGVGGGTALPISAAALPLPSGAASAANQTNGTQQTKITDGTNVAAVKAASTAAQATDPAIVAALSPNGNLPAPKTPIASATFIASAALPAAGAYTSAAAFAISGLAFVSFQVDYTGGAVGGQMKYRIRKGFSATLASMGSEQIGSGGLTISSAVGQRQSYDDEVLRPVTGTAATHFPIDVDVRGGWTHVTLELAEVGATGTPGTAAVTIAGSYQ